MKRNAQIKIVAGLLIALVVAILLIFKDNRNLDNLDSSAVPVVKRDKNQSRTVTNHETIAIPGVGRLAYRSKNLGFASDQWMKQINSIVEEAYTQTEEDLAWRDENGRWNKVDVYYGEDGEILHFSVNKGLFKTYPLDDKAIDNLQNEQGLAILRFGYPESLLKSGYSTNDFVKDTVHDWDTGAEDESPRFEVEVTPVIVKVVSTGKPMNSVKDPSLLGVEIPMLFVKTGSYISVDEAPIVAETSVDGFSYSESIRRTWELKPYAPVKLGETFAIPKIGAGIPLNEPLMEAWKKRQTVDKESGE
jgi:hypothetical protein